MYYSVFQFQYFFADDYAEILNSQNFENHFRLVTSANGRPLQAVIQQALALYATSIYYNYYVFRFVSLVLVYILALLVLNLFNKAFNNKFISLTITIFIFSTPIFSLQVLWSDIIMSTVGYIIVFIATSIFVRLYVQLKNYISKILLTVIMVIILAISNMLYQITTTAPIAIIVILLLFNENLIIYQANNMENKIFSIIGQILYKYQIVFVTIFAVLFAQIVYLYFLQIVLNHFDIEKTGRANQYLSNGILPVLAHLFKVRTNYLLHYYYFGISSKELHLFGLMCIFASIYGIYKDIKSKYQAHNKELYIQTIIRWLIIILCVGANSFIFIIDPSGSLRTKTMQMILLLAILLYSLNTIFKFDQLIKAIAIKIGIPKNIAINISLVFISTIIVFISYTNNLNSFVYMKSVETIFVKSEVLSQLTTKQNATQIAIVQPQNSCYRGGCVGVDEYGISMMTSSDWEAKSMIPAELKLIGVNLDKFSITLITAENATPDNIAQYNNNDTILIDTNALDKAFRLTYKK